MTDRDAFERIDRLVREDIRLRRSGSVSRADDARLCEVERLIGQSWEELLPSTGIDDSHA